MVATAMRPSDARTKVGYICKGGSSRDRVTTSASEPLSIGETSVASFSGEPPKKTKINFHRRADHKSGLKLKAWRFREDIQTPEANVQHRCVGGRIRDGPIEILHPRVTRLCKTHVDRPAAIERKENFRLTHRQVHVWKVRRPLQSSQLVQDSKPLPALGEISLALYSFFSACANAVSGDCGAKANVNASSARMNRGVFIFSVHPSERQLSIAVCAARRSR